ncbi:MAG: RNA polymerase sigma factor (sigma-70 family) [Saprospiraceae bacterium]|jgi:RNA polymerase sigma factor (sigma-70 family)
MQITDKWTDEKLIGALSGRGLQKEQAIDYMMKQYIQYVPTIARKLELDKTLLLDAFTDAIVAVSDQVALGKFKGDSQLSSYFYKIFYFKSVDLLKKQKTNVVEYRENLPEISNQETLTSEKMETNEKIKDLYKYLDRLGEPCKQILIDWGFWGYNMTEIAERTGLKGSLQAKDRKYQCLKKLRKMMT